MKITEGYYDAIKRYLMFPETCYLIQNKNKLKTIAIDRNKS